MKRRKNGFYGMLILLILGIGIGYAILTTNLSINGITYINNASWDVHFANIQVSGGSVSADSPANIDTDTSVSYEVTLSKPGDYYEFTVDVVNGGTIDAMIESVSSKLNGVEISSTNPLPNYLGYSITYYDNVEIENNQLLNAGTTETYKIRVSYKMDINPEDLPGDDSTLSFLFSVTYVQADNSGIAKPMTMYGMIANNAVMDNISSTYVTNSSGVQFNDISSDTNGKGIYERAGTENDAFPIYYYRGAVDNNNVLFANFCWKIVRTTETGGTKLIYNGTPTNGMCTNTTGTSTQLSSKGKFNPVDTLIGSGYMYTDPSYRIITDSVSGLAANTKMGRSYTYDGTNYHLVDTITISSWSTDYAMASNYHYTCKNTSDTCSILYYYYFVSSNSGYSIILRDGTTLDDVLNEALYTLTNMNSSSVKARIDLWFSNNMTLYESMLEDTVWCNDRDVLQLNGWNPLGGDATQNLLYAAYDRLMNTYTPKLNCSNRADSFTKNSANGNGKLTYPVGLITADEVMLAGGKYTTNNSSYYLYTYEVYWTMTPVDYTSTHTEIAMVSVGGRLSYTWGNYSDYGVRPSVSLKLGTIISDGDGTSENPYIVSDHS